MKRGGAEDVPAVARLMEHGSARVREAAVRALRMLGAKGQEEMLLRAVERDVPSVVREAAMWLLADRGRSAVVWNAAKRNGDAQVRRNVLRMKSNAGKWEKLRVFLDAAASDDAGVSDCGVEMLSDWCGRFNETFTPASDEDLRVCRELMAQRALPGGLAGRLEFLLRG